MRAGQWKWAMWSLRAALSPESGVGQLTGPRCTVSSSETSLHPSSRSRMLATLVAGPGLRPGLCHSLAWGSYPEPDSNLLPRPATAKWGPMGWVLQTCLSSPLRAPWSFLSPYPLRSPFHSSPSLLPYPVPAPPSPPPLAIRAAAAGPDPRGSARPLAEPRPPPPGLLRRRPPAGVRSAGHKAGQSRRPGH